MSPVAAAVVQIQQAQQTCQHLRLEGVLGTFGLVLEVERVHEAEKERIHPQSQHDLSVSEEAAAAHVGLPS
jgi:hypothetical protein